MDGAADVAETTCTPFQSEPDAAPVRLTRVKTPATYSYHGFNRPGAAGGRPPAMPRSRPFELKYGVGLNPVAANAAWLAIHGA